MILSELSRTPWFQSNLEALQRTKLAEDPSVRHCIALLGNSKFKECAEISEMWLLTPTKIELWRTGSALAWLANAYSFAVTVAVITGEVIPTGSPLVVQTDEIAVAKTYTTPGIATVVITEKAPTSEPA